MATLEGFGFFEKRSVRQAITDGGRAIDKALKEAFNNNDAFSKRMFLYFGDGSNGKDATQHLVMKSINSMKVALMNDIYKVLRGQNSADNAEASHLHQNDIKLGGTSKRKARTTRLQGRSTYQGKEYNTIEAIMLHANTVAKPEMTLFDQYFAMPYKSHNNQSQVQIFLHELSHIGAGTRDVDKPQCYEFAGVQYCKRIGQASVNAENYGMFLQSYLI